MFVGGAETLSCLPFGAGIASVVVRIDVIEINGGRLGKFAGEIVGKAAIRAEIDPGGRVEMRTIEPTANGMIVVAGCESNHSTPGAGPADLIDDRGTLHRFDPLG